MAKVLTRLGVLAFLVAGVTLLRGPAEVGLAAQEKADLPPDLARISGRAQALVSFRPADLWEGELAKSIRGKLGKDVAFLTSQVKEGLGLEPAAIERVTVVLPMVAQGVEPVAYIAAKQPLDREKFLLRIVPGGQVKKHAEREYFTNDRNAAVMIDDRHYLLGGVGDVQTVLDNWKAKPEGPLLPALQLAAGKHSLVVAANPEGIAMNLNVTGDAEPFKPLFRSSLLTLTVDVAATARGQLRMAFPAAADAKEGAKAVEVGRGLLLESMGLAIKVWEKDASAVGVVGLMKNLQDAVKAAKLKQEGTSLTAAVEMKLEKTAGIAAAEAITRLREEARRNRSVINLKQIGLAMHNYHSTYDKFPPAATYDKDGKPLLSWRVLLLPYLEQDALYKEFRLNEPWDSPHNKKLLAKMPNVYVLPEATPENKHGTFYQVFHGKGAGFEGKVGLRLVDFTDGTSNTILVVEAGRDVPWTKPQDVPFDEGKEVPKLGGAFTNGYNALFGDGSVRFLPSSINKDTLKALITRSGGEVIAGF